MGVLAAIGFGAALGVVWWLARRFGSPPEEANVAHVVESSRGVFPPPSNF